MHRFAFSSKITKQKREVKKHALIRKQSEFPISKLPTTKQKNGWCNSVKSDVRVASLVGVKGVLGQGQTSKVTFTLFSFIVRIVHVPAQAIFSKEDTCKLWLLSG